LKPVQQRYDSLAVARLIGAVLVLTYHFGAIELKYGGDRLVSPLLAYADVIIDLFFVASGFLMATVYRRTPAGLPTAADFALRRMLRIYPSYWLVSLLVVGVWWLSSQRLFHNMVGTEPHLVSSLLLLPSPARPVLQVAWTLVLEVYFYLGFSALLLLKPSWRVGGAMAWAVSVIVGGLFLRLPPNQPGLILIFSPYTLEFIGGLLLGWALPHMRRHAPILALCLAMALWIMGMALTGFDPARKAALSAPVRTVLDGLTALSLVYGLVAADIRRLWTCPARLVAAGDWSYALYLIHTVVIAGVCVVWRKFSGPGLLDNLLAYLAALGLSLALSALIWTRLERPICRSASKIPIWIGQLSLSRTRRGPLPIS